MPVYNYQCPVCKNNVEVSHSIKELGIYKPSCCGVDSQIVVKPSTIIFKGAGWTPKGR